MFPGAPNPTQVQFAPPAHDDFSPLPPLILLHDGGGTTFNYFMLGNIGRDVWAIHDPNHFTATRWEGGIDEMARHYVELVVAAGITGPIVLGGWSLGGYLSIAMARLLALDSSYNITVAGLLMIDAPYHSRQPSPASTPPDLEPSNPLGSDDDDSGDEGSFPTIVWPELVQKGFEHSCIMLGEWDLPEWDGCEYDGKGLAVNVADAWSVLEHGEFVHRTISGDVTVSKSAVTLRNELGSTLALLPPGVMIRCVRQTPWVKDDFRTEKLLGWEGNYPSFIKAVLDIDAEHFTLFDHSGKGKIGELTAQINDGLGVLDGLRLSA